MGTVSEDWHAKKEKQDAMVAEFLSGVDSEDVLRARLYGLGLRGDYLSVEVKQAAARKHALGRDVHIDKGRVYLPNPTKNWNCDNDKCREKHGEVRLYPTGGGGNMILCHVCWSYENRYRFNRAQAARTDDWPQLDWAKAEVYKAAGE